MKFFLFFFFSSLFSVQASQKISEKIYFPGRYLIKVKQSSFFSQKRAQHFLSSYKVQEVSRGLNLYQIDLVIDEKSDLFVKDKEEWIKDYYLLKEDTAIDLVMIDEVIFTRRDKNEKQWHLDDAFGAGNIAFEKLLNDLPLENTPLPDRPIVAAIVDGGFDLSHSDLNSMIHLNKGEVPGNGFDDDANGFVDDYAGFNAFSQDSSTLPVFSHGTHVMGIISALANNNYGVEGIGQDRVKVLPVSYGTEEFGFSIDLARKNKFFDGYELNRKNIDERDLSFTSTAMRAYDYIYQMKKLYLETEGEKGINVMVTNSSFGIDYAKCSSSRYKIWNEMYNKLGSVGVLSMGATANLHIDVDKKGDVPTSCDSDFLVGVSNTDSTAKKYSKAAYGKVSVDLFAPGYEVYSTMPNEEFDYQTGTSMATPVVTGGIGLILSLMGDNFWASYDENPAAKMLEVKRAMLNSVEKHESLEGLSQSDGILNLKKFYDELMR